MTRYKITLEYDGTDLIGWQENRQGPSVQSILRDAIEKFCGERPDIVAAGRTDAGVHALAMVAHFDLPTAPTAQTVMRAMNFYLATYWGAKLCPMIFMHVFHVHVVIINMLF